MAFRSTSSPSRLRNAGFTSAVSNPPSGGFGAWRLLPPPATIRSMAASICLVTSGRAGAPSGVENLMPLYSGGLCEAVKLMRSGGLHAAHGVGRSPASARHRESRSASRPLRPARAPPRPQTISPRKRGSRPTSTRCGSGWVFTYSAMPATASRMLATRKLVGNNGPPPRGAKLDRCAHVVLHAPSGSPATGPRRWGR